MKLLWQQQQQQQHCFKTKQHEIVSPPELCVVVSLCCVGNIALI